MSESWADRQGERAEETLTVRTIGIAEITDALRKGRRDFNAHPTHAFFVAILYPIVGLLVVWAVSNRNLVQLVFPLVAGFALVGPFLAIGLYELSRRIEQGEDVHWQDALNAFQSPSIGRILTLGIVLLVIFLAWVAAAAGIYEATVGVPPPPSVGTFIGEILTTGAGWSLILIGNGVGLLFAVFALSVSVVSFPLLLDRDISLAVAVQTSLKSVVRNPGPMAMWGLIVLALLAIGSVPFLFGLAVVFPILGHATWHLYRAIVGR